MEGNSRTKCAFLLASGSREDSQEDCKCCLWPLPVTQATEVLATPSSRAAVEKPVQSWIKGREVSSTERGIIVGLSRILERQVFYILFYFASKGISRETAKLLLSHMLVNRLTC